MPKLSIGLQTLPPPTFRTWVRDFENKRNVISRGIFTSVKDLDRQLARYIRQHNKSPKPLKWKHANPSRRDHQFV